MKIILHKIKQWEQTGTCSITTDYTREVII